MAVLPNLGNIPNSQRVQYIGEIARPSDADRRCGKRILEYQAPSNDPREELSESRVRVGVRTTGNWNFARDFRVTQRSQGADHAGHDEGNREGRASPSC